MKKILIVEDDKKIALALAVRVRAAGYDVVTAFAGLEGLRVAVSEKPDLVIMDIWMPDAVGILIAERLKTVGLESVPVIFITASKKKELWRMAQEAGAAGFFEKPFDTEELLEAIATVLARTEPLAGVPPSNPPPRKKKILVVEDDEKTATALAIRLRAEGYKVLTAPDGISGLNLATEEDPDLILMDVWLPGGIGFSIAEEIKRRSAQTPIIFVTACKKNELWVSAKEIGVEDFIEKPFEARHILATISRVLAAPLVSSPTVKRSDVHACKELNHTP